MRFIANLFLSTFCAEYMQQYSTRNEIGDISELGASLQRKNKILF